MKSIGKNIRSFRMKQNMTQDELAEKLSISRQTVSNYETGKSQPDVDMIMSIAEVLSVDVNTIIYGKEIDNSLDNIEKKKEIKKNALWAAALVLFAVGYVFLRECAEEIAVRSFLAGPLYFAEFIIRPMLFIALGFIAMRHIALLLNAKRPALTLKNAENIKYIKAAQYVIIAVTALYFALFVWFTGEMLIDSIEVLKLQNQGTEYSYEYISSMPLFIERLVVGIMRLGGAFSIIFIPIGVLLWFTGGAKKTEDKAEK